MKSFSCVQGSPEWFKLRRGIPTASEFSRIIKPNLSDIEVHIEDAVMMFANNSDTLNGSRLTDEQLLQLRSDISKATKGRKFVRYRGYTESGGKDAYAAELIAESLGWHRSFQGSPDTERGHYLEKEAKRWLKLRYGMAAADVGFCLSDCGRYGCSPDGMIGAVPLEVKCPDTHTFIKWRIAGGLPDDHKAQVHGEMFVTGAEKAIFLAYTDNPYLENIMLEVHRDAFTEKLGECVLRFCDRLDELRKQLTGDEYEILFGNGGEA